MKMLLKYNIFIIVTGLLTFKFVLFKCNVCSKDSNSYNCSPSKSKYTKLNVYNNFTLDSSYLLTSFDSYSNLKCLAKCNANRKCFYTIFNQNKCYICNESIVSFLNYISGGTSLIYQKSVYIYFIYDNN